MRCRVDGHGRLQPAETEIKVVVVQIRPGKKPRISPALAGQGVQQPPAGIGQAQDFAYLVKGFAGGVVQRAPQQTQPPRGLHAV